MNGDNNSDLPPPAERRNGQRKRVLLGGVIVFEEGRRTINCKIRDLTEGGARVLFPKGMQPPSECYFINVRDRKGHQAKVSWCKNGEAGLAFVNSFDLKTLEEPGPTYLKKIWEVTNTAKITWQP